MATIFLADAASVNQLDQAPITGADVTVNGAVADPGAEGVYIVEPGVLTYEASADWNVDVQVADVSARAVVPLPEEANVTVPDTWTANTAMELDLTGQDFDSALVIVFDTLSGEITYSNEPQGIREFYDFTHGTEGVGVVEIPAAAFPGDGIYAIGLSGIKHTVPEDLTEMNTALSTIMAGKMRFRPTAIGSM